MASRTDNNRETLVVIGGGAAGYFGAIQAASSASGLDVIVLEKGRLPLQKVKISGGGRCNVMHDTSKVWRDALRLSAYYVGVFTRRPRVTSVQYSTQLSLLVRVGSCMWYAPTRARRNLRRSVSWAAFIILTPLVSIRLCVRTQVAWSLFHFQSVQAVSLIAQGYPRGSKQLIGPFKTLFGPRDAAAWFGSRGVRLKTEGDGRMFPVTDDSQTIIDCLEGAPIMDSHGETVQEGRHHTPQYKHSAPTVSNTQESESSHHL